MFNDRFSIAGAAGILGLTVVLGIYGFLSLLGAEPSGPFDSLGSEENVATQEGSEHKTTAGQSESGPGSVTSEESPASQSPGETVRPTRTPAAAVLAALAPGEARPTPAPGQSHVPPATTPTAVPTPQPAPNVTPDPTPAPSDTPATPTPQPEVCSIGGTPSIRETGKHVRLEFASVLSLDGDVLSVDVAGTVTVLHLTPLTVVTGNLSAATLVRAEGHREVDGTVTADLVDVLCPDSARG
jgi:hypothetical protein